MATLKSIRQYEKVANKKNDGGMWNLEGNLCDGIFSFRKKTQLVTSQSNSAPTSSVFPLSLRGWRPFLPSLRPLHVQPSHPSQHFTGGPPNVVLSVQGTCGHSSGPNSSMGIFKTLLEITKPPRVWKPKIV